MAPPTPRLPDDYYWIMAARRRLLRFVDEQGKQVLCTFFVLRDESDIPRFHDRPAWSTPPDAQDGDIILMDMCQGEGFSKALVEVLETTMAELVPSFTKAIWYRPDYRWNARRVYYRRLPHAADLHS